jgi:ubiquinone/menaquinone biosynthesis C-methylase UbiE
MAASSKTREEIELHKTVGQQYRVRYRFPFAADFQRERNEIILDLLGGDQEMRVLDLGCGTGVMIDTLGMRFHRIVGLDVSGEMIEAIDTAPRKEGQSPIMLVLGDMEALPIRDAIFDRVVMRSSLHHVGSEKSVLADIHRILKPGGRLAVAEPVNDNPLFRLARWKARRGKSYGKIHTIGKAFMTPELRGMLEAAGFVIDREVRYGFLAYPLCDNPDLVPLLKYFPFSRAVAAALRGLDRFLARVPLIRKGAWYTIISAKRPAREGEKP